MKILITGATGLIGKELGKKLAKEGHVLYAISRSRKRALEVLPFPCQIIEGDLSKGAIPEVARHPIEGVVHLLGDSVGEGRWTIEKKRRILNSRTTGTQNLIASLPPSIVAFVSASGIGYYGDRENEELTEDSTPGSDFLAEVCQRWEAEALKVTSMNPQARVVIGRLGVVLHRQEGAFPKMSFPFRAGLGGSLGSGQHWMTWIHHDDVTSLLMKAIVDESMRGIYNFVAPEPIQNKDFSRLLAKALGRPLGFSVPKFALKLALGEMAIIATASQRAYPSRLMKLGHPMKYPRMNMALDELCEPWRSGEELFETEQYVPLKKEEIFPFFAEAKNLEQITPKMLQFKVEKVSTPDVVQGTLIDYKLKIHGVPAKWKTEIAEWNPPNQFVDNQLSGPYRRWHHTHTFQDLGPGTLMTDRVRYRLPMGFLGWLVASQFVKKDVENIFKFRREFISDMKFR